MIIDAQNATFTFNGTPVGKITQYEIADGEVPDVVRRPLNASEAIYAPGMPEYGSVSLTCYRDTQDAGQEALVTAIGNRTVGTCVLTLADGRTLTFDAYVKRVPVTGVIDNVNTTQILLKITGPVVSA